MPANRNTVEEKRSIATAMLNKMIPDKYVCNMLFGNDMNREDFLGDRTQILYYTSKLLIVAYHYLYFRYRRWCKVDNIIDDGPTDNDLIRIFKVMRKMYIMNELSYEAMESVLMDLQIDIALHGAISQELRITRDIYQSSEFARMAYLAKKARTDSRFNDLTPIEGRIDEFMDFIKNFAFLKNLTAKLAFDDEAKFFNLGQFRPNVKLQRVLWENNDFYAESDYLGTIDTFNCLIKVARSYYFLSSTEFVVANGDIVSGSEIMETSADTEILGMKLGYISFDPTASYISVVVGADEKILEDFRNENVFFIKRPYEEYCEENFPLEALINFSDKKPLIEDFYTINFKYIRNLSLAIVDILETDDQKNIYHTYAGDSRFRMLFDGGEKNAVSLQWDVIIAILLVEEGAGKILNTIFSANPKAFYKLVKNLELRFGRELFSSGDIVSKTKKEIEREEKKIHNRNSVGVGQNVFVFDREKESIRVEVQVRTIIVNVTRAVNGNQVVNEKVIFPLSVRSRIQLLESIRDDYSESPRQKIEKTRAIVNQTVSTLIIFYRGLIKYTKQKTAFENESYYRVLSDEEIDAYQNDAQNVFNIEAKRYKRAINKTENDYKKIFDMLRELCNDFLPGKDGYGVLKHMLGRQQLMDCDFVIDTLKECWRADTEHATNSEAYVIINNVIDVFRYLQTGDRSCKDIWDVELSLKAIFPFVATYQYAKQTGDGYHINNFSIISAKGQDINIKVLSEFKYKLNEKYYCLPNKLRSAESLKLWIEPILIIYEEEILDE